MNIINFGSLNIDHVYSVSHLAVPGETVASDKLEIFYGGKGFNQSIAAARAGAHVIHIGKIGENGIPLKEFLQRNNVDVDLILTSDAPNGHAIIQVDRMGQNNIITYGGANYKIDKEQVSSALDVGTRGDIILLQNEISGIGYIIEQAHLHGFQVAFNPSPITKDIMKYPLQYVKWFILNEIEGQKLTGETDPSSIAEKLLQMYPESTVILTLGSKGVLYKDSSTTLQHGTYKVDRVDTTGAGDTFTGYFIAGITKNFSPGECLEFASIASSITVSRKGAAVSIPTIKEVKRANLKI
jgi:ribokinase